MASIAGKKYGRWQVGETYTLTEKGEKKWFCTCECGTERYVLERSLKSGSSLSCGCLRKEEVKKAKEKDLTNQQFGELKVIGKAKNQERPGGTWWECTCSCGKTYEAPATLLLTGKRTHCGCKSKRGKKGEDITGKKYGMLQALYPTEKRDKKGYVMWHCKCDCGKEKDISYNMLEYGGVESCGCKKKAHEETLGQYLTHIEGTSIEMIRSKKVPKNSSTGIRGVYLIRGKYEAKITFQKKTYQLGRYERIEEAKEAREQAEEELFAKAERYYKIYSEKAKADPQWAKKHPLKLEAKQKEDGTMQLLITPQIEEKQPVRAVYRLEDLHPTSRTAIVV